MNNLIKSLNIHERNLKLLFLKLLGITLMILTKNMNNYEKIIGNVRNDFDKKYE